MNNESNTWHYGLVARYWAEHNTEGPEIEYFQKLIKINGQPALDAGCGTGRLLIPFLKAGLDVHGCDVSQDMLDLCQEKARKEGLSPRLYRQALHELDLPCQFQTIVVCGTWGIGVTRDQDFTALKRLYQHLKPGGLLLVDNYLPYSDSRAWQFWLKESRDQLPISWPDTVGKRPPADEADYELFYRPLAFDPVEQRITRQMRTLLWRDGQVVEDKEYTLYENQYFYHEMRMLLEQAGFSVEAVQGDYTSVPFTREHNVAIFFARKS